MPINVHSSHWLLLVADRAERSVGIIDSLKRDRLEYLNHWKVYMKIRANKVGELGGEWTVKNYDGSLQTDSSSCGVFTLMNAESILKGIPLNNVRQENIVYYRNYVGWRLELFSLPYNL